MELLFESRMNLFSFQGHLNFVQHKPTLHPEPVLRPDTPADAKGVQLYGTVMRDGGRLRMWYQAMPQSVDLHRDCAAVGYAESDDGLHWTKPALPFVKLDGKPSNLLTLGLGIPCIWIDPDSPPSHRYRCTGIGHKGLDLVNTEIEQMGYYTAHSADGLQWKLDSKTPRWYSADDIASIYHPQQRRGIISMKWTVRVGRVWRRSLYMAEFKDGQYSDVVCGLVPDEYDDVCAAQRGHHTGDYYGFAMQAAGSGTVGFINNYWHDLPYTTFGHIALFGVSDMTLAYQEHPGGRWLHVPGRPSFFDINATDWTRGFLTLSSPPVEMGDEHWLYFGGRSYSHGFCHDAGWQPVQRWIDHTQRHEQSVVGVLRWPKWRLFGFEGDPDAAFTLHLGRIEQPTELILNYKARPGGCLRVALAHSPHCTPHEQEWFKLKALPGRAIEDCVPLTGDSLGAPAAWKDGTIIQPSGGKDVVVRIELEVAAVFAYELKPVP